MTFNVRPLHAHRNRKPLPEPKLEDYHTPLVDFIADVMNRSLNTPLDHSMYPTAVNVVSEMVRHGWVVETENE